MGLWNNVARFQDGSLKLQKIEKIDTREVLHAAAKLRVEELVDGFNCVVNIMLYDSGVNKWREPAVEG